jgi:16S rRNA G1207 methylase RsmC
MSHYFDEAPATGSAEVVVTVNVPGASFTMRTDRGVFSHGRLDAGTELLLRAAPAPPATGTLLDLGTGSGAIALTLAARSPRATVWAVDVNERARALCAANALDNGLANVRVAGPDDVPADVSFDAIWSNPPIRIGKPAVHALLSRWLRRLATGGDALLVVHKHLGSDSLQRWLIEQGWPTERLTSARGYRLLRVQAP